VAFVKLLTELTTLDALLATVAIWLADGVPEIAVTALVSEFTEDVMALVSLGKSPFAWLTSVLAFVWILVSSAFKPLIPLLAFRLVSPLTEFSRLARAVQ
jgi:hypothetical protein